MQTIAELKEDNDSVIIKLPNGQEVEVWWSYLEPGNQVPELDIILPEVLSVNCFEDNLSPAKAIDYIETHVRMSKELHICIERGYEVNKS